MKVLAFGGSLRKKSYNKGLLRAAMEVAPENLEIEIFDLEGIPLFNADVEEMGDPLKVKEFKEAIRKADGILIASPEYNHGMTGVTKNAIDWASRPPKDPPLAGKPVGIMGASPGMTGTVLGQNQLRQSLYSINAHCMALPEFLVNRAKGKFDDNVTLTDEDTIDLMKKYLKALAKWVEKFK